jgi:replicative DNA helicase
MVIVAARPAVGKSTFALDIARNGAFKHDKPVLFFSLEMSKAEIAMRMLSAESEIHLSRMRGGSLSSEEWKKLASVRGRINDKALYIDDSANLTMVEIRAKSRRLKESLGLELIIVDYLQLLSSGKKVESRQQEVSEFSRSIKLLAKELDIPVIAIAQLNRNAEQKEDKTPQDSPRLSAASENEQALKDMSDMQRAQLEAFRFEIHELSSKNLALMDELEERIKAQHRRHPLSSQESGQRAAPRRTQRVDHAQHRRLHLWHPPER